MKKVFIFLAVVAMIIAPAICLGQSITQEEKNIELEKLISEGDSVYVKMNVAICDEKKIIKEIETLIETIKSSQEDIKRLLESDSLAKVFSSKGLSSEERKGYEEKLNKKGQLLLKYEEKLTLHKNDLEDLEFLASEIPVTNSMLSSFKK